MTLPAQAEQVRQYLRFSKQLIERHDLNVTKTASKQFETTLPIRLLQLLFAIPNQKYAPRVCDQNLVPLASPDAPEILD